MKDHKSIKKGTVRPVKHKIAGNSVSHTHYWGEAPLVRVAFVCACLFARVVIPN